MRVRTSPVDVHLASWEEHLPNQKERLRKLTALASVQELSSYVSKKFVGAVGDARARAASRCSRERNPRTTVVDGW